MPISQLSTSPKTTQVLNRATKVGETGITDVRAGAVLGANSLRDGKVTSNDALFNEQPGVVVKGLDTANSIGNKYFMYDMVVSTLFGGLLGAIGSGFNWLGEKTPAKFMGKAGNALTSTKAALQAPMNFMRQEEVTVSNGLSETTKALHGKTTQWLGEESKIAAGMGKVADKAADAEKVINKHVGQAFTSATTTIGNVLQKVDAPFHAKAGYHARKVEKAFGGLTEQLGAARKVFGEHSSMLGDIPAKLDELHKLMQTQPGASGVEAGKTLLSEIQTGITNLQKAHVDDKALKPALKATYKAASNLSKPLEAMEKHLGKVAFWKDVPGTVRKLPETLANANLHQAAFGGVIMVGTLAEAGHTTFQIKHDFHVLCRMIAEVEGTKEKDVSTWHALTADLPPVLKEARHHFFAKYGPTAVVETLSVGLNFALLKKDAGILAMGGVMAVPMLGNALADQNPLITMYETMEKMQVAGQPLNTDMYAEFLTAAYKKAGDLGERNRLVQGLAQGYEAAKASPAVILKDIASGAIDHKAAELEQKFTEAAKAAPKEAVGKHSEKILSARNGAVQQVTAPNASVAANDGVHETPTNKLTQVAHSEPLKTNTHAVAGA